MLRFIVILCLFISANVSADNVKNTLYDKIPEQEFVTYKNVADFIDGSPKVTIIVNPEKEDVMQYGEGVVKSLTGSDCDRDGFMDDNATCNAVYFKLWMRYKR